MTHEGPPQGKIHIGLLPLPNRIIILMLPYTWGRAFLYCEGYTVFEECLLRMSVQPVWYLRDALYLELNGTQQLARNEN